MPPPTGSSAGRNRYVDLIRLAAIIVVVVGHWLDTTIIFVDGAPVGQSALAVVDDIRWLTLALQVMPLFFVAAGYAAAASWPSWTARKGRWPGWLYGRFARVLRPTTWFVASMACLAAAARLLGADSGVLAQAGWGVALQLWFVPIYLLLLVLAVPLISAWSRLGWLVLAGCAAGVAVVDLLVRLLDVNAAAWANYLLAPMAGFLLGIAWRAGAFARRAVPAVMAVAGAVALLALIILGGYPKWMLGVPGEGQTNTSPPNLALLAYGAAQVGVVLLLEPYARDWLERPRVWATVARGNSVIITLYLWHMVPVLVTAALAGAAGQPNGPPAGTLAWWALRPLWVAGLGVLLAGLVSLVGRFERPGPSLPSLVGWTPALLLLVCAATTGYALSRLAVGGFAPAGTPAIVPLAIYSIGVLALHQAGRTTTGRAVRPAAAR